MPSVTVAVLYGITVSSDRDERCVEQVWRLSSGDVAVGSCNSDLGLERWAHVSCDG